jgi:hypothetical protein
MPLHLSASKVSKVSKVVSRSPADARTEHGSGEAGDSSWVDANDLILRGLRNGSGGGRLETTQVLLMCC